ncbi:MAG: ComF family protein [Hyphomonadaceae bacterium]
MTSRETLAAASPAGKAPQDALRAARRRKRGRAGPPGGIFRPFRNAADWLLRAAWPPRSLVDGQELAGPGLLSAADWSRLTFVSPPLCRRCGMAFEIEVEQNQVCGACLSHPPAYDRARAALIYGDVSRELVLALKRQGRRDGLATMSGWMAQAGGELLAEADFLVPTPLHYWRFVRRGFNQSVWLAQALQRRTGTPVAIGALRRVLSTPSQGGLSANARRRNVQGAFRVGAGWKPRLKGRNVVLVDDVLTTGATVEACARTLKRAGAANVDVIALARVAGPRPIPILG